MFSPICFANFFLKLSSVWAVETENKFLIGPKQFFFPQFASRNRNHNKYFFFNSLIRHSRLVILSDEFVLKIWKYLETSITYIWVVFTSVITTKVCLTSIIQIGIYTKPNTSLFQFLFKVHILLIWIRDYHIFPQIVSSLE